MNFKEELEKLGYVISFSQECPIVKWGKWYVSVKKNKGPQIMGYGDNESLAFEDVLKTARKLEEILK
jgi:hypothetical protein